jgi:hypothetical protein
LLEEVGEAEAVMVVGTAEVEIVMSVDTLVGMADTFNLIIARHRTQLSATTTVAKGT